MACTIKRPTQGPKAGTTFQVQVSGTPPLEWTWSISGDGSGSGESDESPATVSIGIPEGTEGEELVLNLHCTMGSDAETWTIS
ncbi:MAG: hypothetical protein AB1486_09510 [Planctomycetota bacterium]